MDSASPLALVQKYWLLVLVIAGLSFAASVAAFGTGSSSNVSGSATLTVQSEGVYPESDRVYVEASVAGDLQQASAISQSWLADPALVSEALSKANVGGSQDLKALAQVFKVSAVSASSSVYQVQYTGSSEANVKAVYGALRDVLAARQESYNADADTALKVEVDLAAPYVSTQGSSLPLMPVAGLLSGLVFALLLASLLERRAKN